MSHPKRPSPRPIKLYGFPLSGHSHRAQLFLSLLGLPVEYVAVDLAGKQQKSPDFIALNPFGQVPVIDDDGTVVADSNAILVYLAMAYGDDTWLPRFASTAAAVQRWLSVAAGSLASGPGAARFARVFTKQDNPEAVARAHDLLQVMDGILARRDFLAGRHATIADVAMYSYTAHAPEGGVSLGDYPYVRTWLSRIEGLPGFVAMARAPA